MYTSPSRIHYVSIAWVAFTLIAMQVLLSRIFSVMLFYHFAFAGVTLAMFGLTVGALKVHLNPGRYNPATLNERAGWHSARCALLLSLSIVLMVDVPGRLALLFRGQIFESLATLGVIIPCVIIGVIGVIYAFISAGVVVTMLLTSTPAYTSRLYAIDLIGASMGVVLMIIGLKFLDPVSLVLLICAGLALIGVRLLRGYPGARHAIKLAVALALITLVQAGTYMAGSPLLRVRVGKVKPIEDVLFERWNTYSHVAVHPNPRPEPFGWGFGQNNNIFQRPPVPQYWLRIDAEAGTVLTNFDGDTSKVDYLKQDVINFGYHMRDIQRVAVIGVGGGRDILSAIVFGVKNITGIEINPAIFEALNVAFADFTGNMGKRPEVSLVNAEARSYLYSHPKTYDMIQISLIDTWAATAAGGLTLTENKLYTLEAWKEFLARLDDKGMLSVSRWFVFRAHEGEMYRMLSLANDAIRATIPGANPHRHVLAASAQDVINMLVSKSPLTDADVKRFYDICQKQGFQPILAPDRHFSDFTKIIIEGEATRSFYDGLPILVDSPTDDKPFFFNMTRIADVMGFGYASGVNLANNIAAEVLLAMALLAVIGTGYTTLLPLRRLYRSDKTLFDGAAPYITYFMCIGLGFMLIEMSLMQRLMIFLGHPIYSLSVILLTMLLCSGIGSYTVNPQKLTRKTYIMRPYALATLLIITAMAVPYVTQHSAHLETTWRIVVSVLLLAPISFFMGMMFPLGVSLAEKRKAELLPWFWALNGVASVLASIGAVIISMQHGITATYMLGVGCYLVCAAISGEMGTLFAGKDKYNSKA